MKKIIKDYFSFNSRERVAILLLCCLMVFFWMLPDWFPDQKKEPNAAAFRLTEPSMDSSIQSLSLTATKPIPVSPAVPLKLFVFDPNLITVTDWEKLGVKAKIIQTIQHYIQKGGRFHKPEDIKKIWGILPEEAERLIPYIQIEEPKKMLIDDQAQHAQRIATPIHINQATVTELESLPGMNKFLAARMIKFRDKIGGFQNLDQVRRTYGLSDSVFNLIAPLIEFKD